jgi:DNA-directed RNA polymerase specialized sigma24 family protein
MLQATHFVDERPASYPASVDFCRALTEQLQRLYVLSLLLTADDDKAERCFVSAMSECGEGAGVFTEWACSWARRAVIKHAIQMIRPAPDDTDISPSVSLNALATSPGNNTFAPIVTLGAFERFVFILSILEGQSQHDCAVLLRCSPRDVMIARALALTRLGSTKADEFMQA